MANTVRPMNVRVPLDERTETQGDVLCEQVRIIDLEEHPHRVIESVPHDILLAVYRVVNALIMPSLN